MQGLVYSLLVGVSQPPYPSAWSFCDFNFFRPCFFSEAKKAKERFKVVVVGGGSDR